MGQLESQLDEKSQKTQLALAKRESINNPARLRI